MFRENAARALLLPRRLPGRRTPLWVQRRRSSDLLRVASRFGEFPIVLETFRACLRDVFDLPGLVQILRAIGDGGIEARTVETRTASPFSSTLMFAYVASFLYQGDAPAAERRAQALALDQGQLRDLLGDAEWTDLLDPAVIADELARRQRLAPDWMIRDADGLHDLLRHVGDLSREEITARTAPERRDHIDAWLAELGSAFRVIPLTIAGTLRFGAAEDASRFRDALGVSIREDLPRDFTDAPADPLGDLVARHARVNIPFTARQVGARFGLGPAPIETVLNELAAQGRVIEGAFLQMREDTRQWCDAEVLRTLKRRSLARLRKQIEPVDATAVGRFLPRWQGATEPTAGLETLLSAIEKLQGAPLLASALEDEILPARVKGYEPRDVDELAAAGEIVWCGLERVGTHDGRIAVFLADDFANLGPPAGPVTGEKAERVRSLLSKKGALFFSELLHETGFFAPDLQSVLWDMVWSSALTNDTLAPLRSLRRGEGRTTLGRGRSFASRRRMPRGTEGRWSLLPHGEATPTLRQTALARQLLARHGVVTREAITSEGITGGFAAVYPIYKAMEETGRVRRGYFVAGLGATQFAVPGAEDRLREQVASEPVVLAATDPANPYGAALPWPRAGGSSARMESFQRAAGALVVLVGGNLAGYHGRPEDTLTTVLPEDQADRQSTTNAIAAALARHVRTGPRASLFITHIDDVPAAESPLATAFRSAGFDQVGDSLRIRKRLADS
jgi:ATP-dependent Lhr-like helicase